MEEEWRAVPGYEGLYEASSRGRIRNAKTQRIMRQHIDPLRGCRVRLSRDGSSRTLKVHRLVALAFLAKPENKDFVCHDDGNNKNNHVVNLRWDTLSANQNDRVRHGTHGKGERNSQAKLMDCEVAIIKRRLLDGCPRSTLAKDYGVSLYTIRAIDLGTNWKEVTPL